MSKAWGEAYGFVVNSFIMDVDSLVHVSYHMKVEMIDFEGMTARSRVHSTCV